MIYTQVTTVPEIVHHTVAGILITEHKTHIVITRQTVEFDLESHAVRITNHPPVIDVYVFVEVGRVEEDGLYRPLVPCD